MPRTVSSTEAQSNFGTILRATRDEHEEIIVKHYGEPVAALISYSDYEELLKMRQHEKRRKVLAALDRLRDEVQRQGPPLSAEEAYRLAGFDEGVVQSTLAKDRELADSAA
ncbi:MAG: type II toxin-antitoxin system Phd/YefM family antitoxin [Caldilineaceae bacterium]|nr:type II toxin-antitoxin system Phd/YefM family antitoxin [Caldilineaceae bacterium]